MSQMSLTGEAGGYAPNSGASSYDEIRPLSVRMRESIRAQLDVLAQLNDRSVTEETRLALEHWVERAKSDPSLKERADRVRAEIDQEVEQRRRSAERDAEHRRQAIAAVLGTDAADASESVEEAESDEDTDLDPDQADLPDDSEQNDQTEPGEPEQAETPAEEPAETADESEPPVKQARIRRGKAASRTSRTADEARAS